MASSQPEHASKPLSRHAILYELMQKEMMLGRSLFDTGVNVVNDAFTSLPKASSITLELWPTMMNDPHRTGGEFRVYRNDQTNPRREGQCVGRFTTSWSFNTTIDLSPIEFDVKIQTSKTRTANAQTAGGSASEPPFSQESEIAGIGSAVDYQLDAVHRTLIDRLKSTQDIHSQALASQLAKLAFSLSDEISDGSRLTNVSVVIYINQNGVHGAIATMRSDLSRSEYEDSRHPFAEIPENLNSHLVYVALGSNIGDRVAMLDLACRELDHYGIRVVRTSALYETKPMYLEAQRSFVNGVCEVCWS